MTLQKPQFCYSINRKGVTLVSNKGWFKPNPTLWTDIDDTQVATWTQINDNQTAGWADTDDTQTPNWTEVVQ